jgi:hypothetical protein
MRIPVVQTELVVRRVQFPLHLHQQTPSLSSDSSPPQMQKTTLYHSPTDIVAPAVNSKELYFSSSSLVPTITDHSTSPTLNSSWTSIRFFSSLVAQGNPVEGVVCCCRFEFIIVPYSGQNFLDATTLVCSLHGISVRDINYPRGTCQASLFIREDRRHLNPKTQEHNAHLSN